MCQALYPVFLSHYLMDPPFHLTWSAFYPLAHFTDYKTEAQKGPATFPKSHSSHWLDLGHRLRPVGLIPVWSLYPSPLTLSVSPSRCESKGESVPISVCLSGSLEGSCTHSINKCLSTPPLGQAQCWPWGCSSAKRPLPALLWLPGRGIYGDTP